MKHIFITALMVVMVSACKQEYTPKRKAYPRIDFPEKAYNQYIGDCPFTFEYPVYATVVKDSGMNAEPCWLNMKFTDFNATLHLTYKPVKNEEGLAELEKQSTRYAYEHSIKAQDITPQMIDDTAKNMYITTFNLSGETATSFRFFATDNKQHFLDGAFYFNTRTNIDSIAPVQQFLIKDLEKMLETLQWKQ